MTANPSGRRGQASRSVSLGASDPRARRAPQEALTDLDLEAPLKINRSGQISLDLSGALTVNPDGSIGINVSNGITVAPGSPLSIQLDIDDDSLVIGPNKKVRARPRMSQIVVDSRDVREVTGRNLAEVIDQETELLKRKGAAGGYCELDSSSKVPVARVPFDLIPLSIKLSSVNDPTYNHIILRFDDSGSSAAVNYLGVVNSDAGLPVIFKSDGADADVGIEITTKGLGVLTVNGSAVEFAANKNIAGGYAGLGGSAKVAPAQLGTGVIVGTEFLRADQTYVLDSRSAEGYQHSGANGAGAAYYIANSVQNTALSTGAPSANTMRAMPFVAPARGGTISEVAFHVTTGVAGNCRVGIYSNSADDNLYPGALLFDSGSISVASSGVQTAAASINLSPGRLYWAVIVGDAAPTIRTLSVNNCGTILGYGTAMGTAGNVGISLAHTYAALPDPFGAGGAYITASPVPALAYKV